MHLKYIITIIILLLTRTHLTSQNKNNLLRAVKEKIVLFTDKMLYVTGEQICFTVFTHSIISSKQTDLSKIFYVELIYSNGKKIVKKKHPIINSSGNGILTVPHELISGNYFIRTYTKYMRNLGPETYFYVPVKIVNPKENSMLRVEEVNSNLIFEKSTKKKVDTIGIQISTNKKIYSTREQVKFTLKDINNLKDQIKRVCISVVPKPSVRNKRIINKKINSDFKLNYSHETRGLTMTGKLIETENKKGIAYKTIHLSVIGNNSYFMSYITDSKGRFFFHYRAFAEKMMSIFQ